MYMTGKKTPIEAIELLTHLTAENLHSDLVNQDVLILTGRDDHLVPFKMHKKQVNALVNARSVEDKIFYKKDSASNHCQIGNMGLALNTMLEWIKKTS